MKGSLTKVCKTCKQELSVSEFHSNGKGKRKRECKVCLLAAKRAITARWQAEHGSPQRGSNIRPGPPPPGATGKSCRACKEFKLYEHFHVTPANRDGRAGICKACRAEWYKDYHRQKVYGISSGDYAQLLAAQDGKCAICRRPPEEIPGNGHRELAIDHDRRTGKVRGLLCSPCNTAIGLLNEDPLRLQAAEDYLELNNKEHTNAA